MLLGMVIGIVRMLMDFILPQPACGEPDSRPFMLMKVHYLYFAMILMAITVVITVVVSLVTPAIDDKCVSIDSFIPMELFLSEFGIGNFCKSGTAIIPMPYSSIQSQKYITKAIRYVYRIKNKHRPKIPESEIRNCKNNE